MTDVSVVRRHVLLLGPFLALRNPKDEGHVKAVAFTQQLQHRQLVTTAWILTAVADALAKPLNRGGFSELLAMLHAQSNASIVPATQDVFERGIDLYQA